VLESQTRTSDLLRHTTIMNTKNTELNTKELKEYSAPTLNDYGKMSELTEALSGPGTGDDGTFPSYSTQFS